MFGSASSRVATATATGDQVSDLCSTLITQLLDEYVHEIKWTQETVDMLMRFRVNGM